MWYTPRSIAELKLINSSRGGISYNFVLDEIIAKRLFATNFGQGKTPYWRVLGKDILKYKNENNFFIG